MLIHRIPFCRALLCPLFAVAVLSLLTPVGALALTPPQPCVAPPGPANLQPAPGVYDDVWPYFSWDSVPEAIYYHLFITRDGQTYKSVWLLNQTGWSAEEPLAGGSYTWSVRAWSPCGTSDWVRGGTYTVKCATLAKPAPYGPDGSTYTGSEDFINPNFRWGTSGAAAWAQVDIRRNGRPFLKRWLNQGAGSTSRYISFGYGFFPNGSYTWAARDWSSCGGLSEWSDSLNFTVNATPCSGPPPQVNVQNATTEFSPLAGLVGGESSARPYAWWNGLSDVAWYQVEVQRAGQVVHSEWIKRQTQWQAGKDLPAGNLSLRVRAWNKCGLGPWSAPEFITVGCVAGSQVTGLRDFGCLYGYGLGLSFDVLPGVSWYQVIMRKDGREIYREWHDWTNPRRLAAGPNAIEAPYGSGQVDLTTMVPCGEGEYEAFVRGWSLPCGVSDWTGPIELTGACEEVPPSPVWPVGNSSDTQPLFTFGQTEGETMYDLVLRRNGKKYYRTTIAYPSRVCGWAEQVEQPSSFDPTGGTARGWRGDDDEWELQLPFYFQFCGGSYDRCYVSANGVITFDTPDINSEESEGELADRKMIAALWDDLRTDINPGDDIFVTEREDSVTIRWQGVEYGSNLPVNFAVTLYRGGTVRCRYGAGNARVDHLIGISAGDGSEYLMSTYSGTPRTWGSDIIFSPLRSWRPFWRLPLGDYQYWLSPHGECDGKRLWSTAGSFGIVPL